MAARAPAVAASGPRGFVLTFHAQNVFGRDFATNDHVALDETLALLRRLRVPVLRLVDVVARLRLGRASSLPPRYCALTFDDGTDFEWMDVEHPQHGVQPSMVSILRRHSRGLLARLGLGRARVTSFVIASPEAREEIAASMPHLPNRMQDAWWAEAQRSGFFDIGVHSWNHVHPAVREMKDRAELAESFHRIRTPEDADLQVGRAAKYVREKAGPGSARLFAWPYGQVSEYVEKEVLPAQREILGAFTTEPAPLLAGANPWRLPRYVSGFHFRDAGELAALVGG